jgi:fructokinase
MTTKFKIAGIGELLWDLLPEGKQLGGAPCNFAYHALQTGFDSYVISAVGADSEGEEIFQVMDQLGLNTSHVQSKVKYPTGTVTVVLDPSGIPDYTIHEHVAWDHIEWNKNVEELAGEVDAVCFGSLAQRNKVSLQTIWKFLEATKPECLRVFDINLRQSYYNRKIILKSLEFATVLKLNEDELPVVADFLGYKGDEEEILGQLLSAFQLQLIAYTKGSLGSLLITKKETSFCQVPDIEIADTVGAGDSFTAILLSGMLRGMELKKIHHLATEVAAYVCTQQGATPELPKKLINQIENHSERI